MRKPIPRACEGLCAVCRCRDAGYGVREGHSPMLWICDDPECLDIARNSIKMRQDKFSKLERDAVMQGAKEAGEYLETIGKTDLVDLSLQEWDQFCESMIGGYRHALKDMVRTENVPF